MKGLDRGDIAPNKLDVHIHFHKEQSDAKGGEIFFINSHIRVVFNPLKAVSLRIRFTDLYIQSLNIIEHLFSARCYTGVLDI